MKEGEKPVGSGTVYKVYGLSRGDLTDLEDLDGLDFVGKKEKRHRWYLSEVAEAKKRREIRRQQEAEARRRATGWDNGVSVLLEGCKVELAETKARIRKEQDKRIKKLSDQAVREIEAEKAQAPVAKNDWSGQFKALLDQVG